MAATRVLRLGVALATLALGPLSCESREPFGRLNGTWGLPPDDAKPPLSGSYWSFSGSYLSVFNRDALGQAEAKLFLNAEDWHCYLDGPVVWNGRRARFEYGERARFEWRRSPREECWFSAEPAGERLTVAISCSRRCRGNEVLLVGGMYTSMEKAGVHEFLLDRIAEDRLVPPPGVKELTFCASHDVLRQELCRSGSIDASVERARRAAEKLRVLGSGDKAEDERSRAGWSVSDTKKPLLAALATCHARGGDASCLQAQIDDQAHALEVEVARRQAALAEEAERSSAAETRLNDATVRRAWEGTWRDDKRGHTIVIENCGKDGCDLSPRHCGAKFHFTGASSAYGYLKDGEARMGEGELHQRWGPWTDRKAAEIIYAAERQPWANYCRFDLVRTERGIRLDLRGAGCGDRCRGRSELRREYNAARKRPATVG